MNRFPLPLLAMLGVLMAAPSVCPAAQPPASQAPVSQAPVSQAPVSLDDSLLQVLVTHQPFDPVMPWQKRPPAVRSGYAIMVSPTHAITTWSMVRNHTLVEVRKARSGRKIPASVELQDHQVNLALLRIGGADAAHPSAGPTLKPLVIAPTLPPHPSLQAVQFDETGQIQTGQAHLLHRSMSGRRDIPFSFLSFTLLTDLNITGEGAPVLQDGAIAGIMITYDRSSRTGSMIPYPTLRRFMEDSAVKPYRGFASPGVRWTALVDPAKRAFLGLDDSDRGILVLSRIPPDDNPEALKPNDVILQWDGHDIDNLGFYSDPDFGRLGLAYLAMGRRKPGDRVPVRIVRDRQPRQLEIVLERYEDEQTLIPENVDGKPADYLVEGGLVIRELTGDYLKAFGPSWARMLDPRLVYTYQTRQFAPSTPGERVVLLSMVLPDPINIGYQGFHHSIVTAANGKPVTNLAHLFRIRDADGSINRLSLKSIGVDIVLDEKQLPAANLRLARSYRIPELRRQDSAGAAK